MKYRIVLPVLVDGSETLPVTLDTGMPIDGIHVFQKNFAGQLNPERAQEVRADGIIGNRLLLRFNVIFNMTEACLYLKPNRRFDEPFSVDPH